MSATSRFHAALAAVDALPYNPRAGPSAFWARVKGAADMLGHNVPAAGRFFVAVNPYPHPFRLCEIRTPDDARLAAWLAPGDTGKPGLLVMPGTFHTKDDTMRKSKAIRAWRAWGWSVLVMDQRGFGGSSSAEGTGGLLEAQDVLDAARHLREETGCARVGVLGESLGGAAALNAASLRGAEDDLAAVTAWSPFADLAEAVRHVTVAEGESNATLAVTRRAYRALVQARSGGRFESFDDYLSARAEALGIDVRQLLELSSPVRRVRHVRVPTLVVHAEDDPVVPVTHARRLAEAGRANPLFAVRVVPAGQHLYFDALDATWYWGVLDAFLRRLAEDRPAEASP